MGISFVGSAEGSTITTTNITVTLPAMQQDDIVYLAISTATNSSTGGTPVTSGYTQIGTDLALGGGTGMARLYRKAMGASPDASVVVKACTTTAQSVIAVAFVLRGVDQTTPEDAAPTTALLATSGTNPNPPAVTTVTPAALVLSIAYSLISDTAVVAPTGYSNQVDRNTAGTGTENGTCAIASLLKVAPGTEDPATWTGWASAPWSTITLAVRPAIVPGIAIVGAAQGNTTTTTDFTITLPTMVQNDVAYLITSAVNATGGTVVSAGWTEVVADIVSSGTHLRVFRKVMGSTPDASVTVDAVTTTTRPVCAIVIVLRGVDTTTPEDVTPTTSTGASGGPNPAAITTATADAWVLVASGANPADASIVAPSGYTNQVDDSASSTFSQAVGVATKLIASPSTEDPAVWGTWTTTSWASATLAIRPAATAIVFTASDLATSSPVLATPTLVQKHVLPVATPIAVVGPTPAAATLTQIHVLPPASAIAVTSPVLGAPGIGITSVFAGVSFAGTSPALGTPALIIAPVALAASVIAVGSPVIGSAAIVQRHVLAALDAGAGVPVMGSATFAQQNLLAATGASAGSPVLGSFSLQQLRHTFAHPNADASDGTWITEAESTLLYASIDEAIGDTGDYIMSAPNPVNDVCKIKLADHPDIVAINPPYGVSYIYARFGDAPVELRVRLLQGTTQIASWTHSDIPPTPTSIRQVLTAPEYAAISNFNDLYLEFRGNA